MKTKYILLTIIAGIILPAYLTSCGEDRWAAYAGQTETDRWIDDTMRVWYYWNEEIPHTDELNYFKTPASFFNDLLSKSDQFSYIDSIESNSTRSIPYTDYSYGFEYATARISGSKDGVMALMLYVAPDSPADEAGLKRGDWIIEMDGDTLTQATATQLLGSGAKEIVTGRYNPASDKVEASATPITLPAARAINDNPVHHQEVLTTAGGRKVGYLVYNHFTPGTGTEYDRQLREVFAGFKAAQINDLVLDLRYNNGGLAACAQLLSSMIAPASQLGTPMAYTEYNKRIGSEPHGMNFLTPELIGEGANLNLPRLYVLTGDYTASASELVINSLRPLMEVILIGKQTIGKNVGSIEFRNERLQITMHPIVCKIYNSLMESDYENGFQPDHAVTETEDLSTFLPFGNPGEALLHKALNLIDGVDEGEGGDESETRGITPSAPYKFTYSSLERSARSMLIMNR